MLFLLVITMPLKTIPTITNFLQFGELLQFTLYNRHLFNSYLTFTCLSDPQGKRVNNTHVVRYTCISHPLGMLSPLPIESMIKYLVLPHLSGPLTIRVCVCDHCLCLPSQVSSVKAQPFNQHLPDAGSY